MRPFVSNTQLKGKKWILVVPAAEGAEVCKPLIQLLRLSFDYLETKFVGQILVTAYEKGEVGGNQAELKRAYHLGMSLK